MLVKQLQHHTAFLVSKLVLLILSFFFLMASKRSSEMKSKEKHHTHTYKLKEKKNFAQLVCQVKLVSNYCPLEATLLNYTSSSQSGSSSAWRLTDRMSKCRLKNFPAAKSNPKEHITMETHNTYVSQWEICETTY